VHQRVALDFALGLNMAKVGGTRPASILERIEPMNRLRQQKRNQAQHKARGGE
jgi:hypothetical protein